MEEKRISKFTEFWPFYMGQHRHPLCRALHYGGSLLVIVILVYTSISGQPLQMLWALPAGYGPAWVGHFLIEKNRPATFQYPLFSLLADYVMLFYFLTGRISTHIPKAKDESSHVRS